MPTSSNKKTYVYEGVEVIKTGRTASRSTARKRITLYEIKPYDNENGSWSKWVKYDELYEILGEND